MTWRIGDKVAIKTGPSDNWHYEIIAIFKITKTQIVLMDGRRFRKSDRRLIDGKLSQFARPYIESITPEVLKHNARYDEDRRKNELIRRIRATTFSVLSIETLETILELCESK